MAATKKKMNAKEKPKAKPKSKPAPKSVLTEEEIKIKNEIFLLLAIAVTCLLEASCMGLISPVGDYISYVLFGMFGFLAYIMPVLVLILVAFILSNKNNRVAKIKCTAASVLFIVLVSMFHLIAIGHTDKGSTYYFMHCGKYKTGGGLIGSMFSDLFCAIIGEVGTAIVLIVVFIICLIIITEKSFIGGVKSGSKKIYDKSKDNVKSIKEKQAIRAEQYREEKRLKEEKLKEEDFVQTLDMNKKEKIFSKKKKRIHNKVKGVDISKLENPKKQDEGIHEITDTIPQNAKVYKGKVDMDYKEETEKTKIILNKNQYEFDLNNEDEDGLFTPKEKIEVSESAKAVMARGVYGAGKTVKKEEKVEEPKTLTVETATEKKKAKKGWVLPSTTLLNRGQRFLKGDEAELKNTAETLELILKNFGVTANVTEYHRGPSVTRYEIQPEIGTRLNKITALADDIKLNLAATDIRIEPVPGKSTIGIEVPNKKRESVLVRDLIESDILSNNKSRISFAAGMDIGGEVVVGDIAKMPHMLVAGTTGSGKSVFTNSIIMSILYRATPDEVRLIIVDPKVVEFGVYNGIPHLLQPVVTDPKLASNTLKWAVSEMSDRYNKFAALNVRDIKGYNEKMQSPEEKMPQIVIVIDELADLMMVAAKEVEESICRLAQLARAAGIHLIIATQRPSVDVVTGLIKANIPSRVALMVSSGVDSRTIIDANGAEKLLGNGDMLFYPSGYPKPVRLQGAFVSDEEVAKTVEFWKNQAGEVKYDSRVTEFVAKTEEEQTTENVKQENEYDEYFYEAARFCVEKEKASTSMLQRMFKIGFNRASRIIDQLEKEGIIGAEEGTKPRKVLITMEELERIMEDEDRYSDSSGS